MENQRRTRIGGERTFIGVLALFVAACCVNGCCACFTTDAESTGSEQVAAQAAEEKEATEEPDPYLRYVLEVSFLANSAIVYSHSYPSAADLYTHKLASALRDLPDPERGETEVLHQALDEVRGKAASSAGRAYTGSASDLRPSRDITAVYGPLVNTLADEPSEALDDARRMEVIGEVVGALLAARTSDTQDVWAPGPLRCGKAVELARELEAAGRVPTGWAETIQEFTDIGLDPWRSGRDPFAFWSAASRVFEQVGSDALVIPTSAASGARTPPNGWRHHAAGACDVAFDYPAGWSDETLLYGAVHGASSPGTKVEAWVQESGQVAGAKVFASCSEYPIAAAIDGSNAACFEMMNTMPVANMRWLGSEIGETASHVPYVRIDYLTKTLWTAREVKIVYICGKRLTMVQASLGVDSREVETYVGGGETDSWAKVEEVLSTMAPAACSAAAAR